LYPPHKNISTRITNTFNILLQHLPQLPLHPSPFPSLS
jgi:hypothetical protein